MLAFVKKEIHPNYHTDAKVTCSCGNTFTVGSTKPEIKVEICSACHPFFTGSEKVMDTAGRVEKFRARLAAGQARAAKTSPRTPKKTKAATE